MTHSLHRMGRIDDLKNDYVVVISLAKGYNRNNPKARENLIKAAEILKSHNPNNLIPKFTWRISPVITAVFTSRETVRDVVKNFQEANLGLSVVISGIIEEIQDILDELDLNMHTVHLSLGTFGKKKLLPSRKEILEITSMCGHHCISPQSIEHYLVQIKQGKLSTEKAAEKLAKPCVCGIFNTERAKAVLKQLLKKC